MSGPLQRTTLFCFLLLLIALDAAAADKTTLLKVNKSERQGFSRILLDFSSLPVYRIESSGERVNLIMSDTKIDPAFNTLSEDQTIVKMLRDSKAGEIVVSFLLRRPPRLIDAFFLFVNSSDRQAPFTGVEPAKLAIDLFWDEEVRPSASTSSRTKSRLAIMTEEVGRPVIQPDKATSSRRIAAGYSGQWEKFIEEYEVPVKIPIDLRYSHPPFPCLELLLPLAKEQQMPDIIALTALGKVEDWHQALSTLGNIDLDKMPEKERDKYFLIRGELLLHRGDYSGALDIFKELADKQGDTIVSECAKYLAALARADSGQLYDAAYELALMLNEPTTSHKLTPYLKLLQAEIALQTGQIDKVRQLLTDMNGVAGSSIRQSYALRRADALFVSDKKQEALVAYREVLKYADVVRDHPFSLAGYASTLSRLGEYNDAVQYYNILAIALDGRSGQDLALYSAIWNQLKIGNEKQALSSLKMIIETFPGTEGYFRARLKVNDLMALAKNSPEERDIAGEYGEIAAQAPLRELREEAAFKQALVCTLRGEPQPSVEYLQKFLRDYSNGTLHDIAQTLLVELLPVVIKKKIEEKDYIQALVLAEQNRAYLINGQVNGDFLAELGLAFAGLWFWNRAARVYLYLLDVTKGKAEEEKVFLPLIQAFHEKGDYDQVEEYASRFQRRFPAGDDLARISYLRISALHKSGRLEKAVRLLTTKKIQESPALNALAGKIFWELGEYDEAEKFLRKLVDRDPDNSEAEDILLLAEALFRGGKGREALPFYQHISQDEKLSDQAIYRTAQIMIATDNHDGGLKLLKGLVEKARSPLWRKMAEEKLAMEKL